MASSTTPPTSDDSAGTTPTAPNTLDPESTSGTTGGDGPQGFRTETRNVIACVLAIAFVGQLLAANIVATSGWWRMALTFGAVCCAVGILQFIPESWRNRLATVAIAFATVAGVVPLFLVDPGEDSPSVDPVALAAYVERGPFDQRLPYPLQAKGVVPSGTGNDSAPTTLAAVELKLGINPKAGVILPDDHGEETFAAGAYLEIFPTGEDAEKRGHDDMKKLAKWNTPLNGDQDLGNFCFQGAPGDGDFAAYWECRGVRGNAFASVTLTPGDNAHLGWARDTVRALLNYSDSMARKATPSS